MTPNDSAGGIGPPSPGKKAPQAVVSHQGRSRESATDANISSSPESVNIRSRTPEPPYCWQSKEARRIIREKMNGAEATSSVLSLYDALTEIASNEGKESFTAGQPYIATIAGISARSVRRFERELEEFGLVAIFRPALRGHHTYTLLSLGHNGPTLGQQGVRASCPPVEVTKEGTEKNHIIHAHILKDAPAGMPSPTAPNNGAGGAGAFSSLSEHHRAILDRYNRFARANRNLGFRRVNKLTYQVMEALNRFSNDSPEDFINLLQSEAKDPDGERTLARCNWGNY